MLSLRYFAIRNTANGLLVDGEVPGVCLQFEVMLLFRCIVHSASAILMARNNLLTKRSSGPTARNLLEYRLG